MGWQRLCRGEEDLIPPNSYASVWDTMKIKAILPEGLLLRSAPTRSNQRGAQVEIPSSLAVPALAFRGTLGQASLLSQSTEMGPSHRIFVSWLEATQMHKNNPGRRNKTCQYYKKHLPRRPLIPSQTAHSCIYCIHPCSSESYPKMLCALLIWSMFDAQH